MSKSRIIAGAAALAMTTSVLAAPVSHAAYIGKPNDQDQCTVVYTGQEKAYETQYAKNFSANMDDVFHEASLRGYDSVFPGSLKFAQAYAKEADVIKWVRLQAPEDYDWNVVRPARDQKDKVRETYANSLEKLGMPRGARNELLDDIEEHALKTERKKMGIVKQEELTRLGNNKARVLTPEGKAQYEESLRDPALKNPNSAEFQSIIAALIGYSTLYEGLTEEQSKAFTRGMQSYGPYKELIEPLQAYFRAGSAADYACTNGGDTQVPYPTASDPWATGKPGNNGNKNPGNTGTPGNNGSPSNPTQGSTNPDGSLTVPAIVGIVFGVLFALIAGAAVLLPQVNINLGR